MLLKLISCGSLALVSVLLSQQMGVMQERMDAFSAMRTSAASSLHRIPAGIGQDEALQQHKPDQHRQD